MKYSIITPFLIVFGIVEIILLLATINYFFINNSNGMALGGVITLAAFIIILLLLAIERIIAESKKINLKVLWIVEIVLILVMAIFVLINGISIG